MNRRLFHILVAFYVTALILSNIIAGKLIDVGGVVLPAAVFIFPVVYILDDIIPEVYGWALARQAIMLGFAANLFAVAVFMLALALPPAPFWGGQNAFELVLGFTPRLLVASFVAYLVGTHANAWVLVRVKEAIGGRLWVRTVSSTIIGESLDAAIFITLAFYGIVPTGVILHMIIAQAVTKILVEVILTPATYVAVGAVQKVEGVEVTGWAL